VIENGVASMYCGLLTDITGDAHDVTEMTMAKET
jgi:hypothetical protein